MLKGAKETSSPNLVRDEKPATLENPTELKAERQDKSKLFQPQLLAQQWGRVLKQVLRKIIDTFWVLPTWFVATVSAVLFVIVYVSADENSLQSKVLESAEALNVVVAFLCHAKLSGAFLEGAIMPDGSKHESLKCNVMCPVV